MLEVRNIPEEIVYAVLAAQQQRQVDGLSTFFHQSRTEITNRADYKNPTVTRVTVSAATATDLATSLTLVNELKADYNVHVAAPFPQVHNAALSAVLATADGTDLATAITLANAIKAAYNTHLAAASVHYTNDSTNATAAANATDQTTLNTLVNELKTDLNAHMAGAPAGTFIKVSPA